MKFAIPPRDKLEKTKNRMNRTNSDMATVFNFFLLIESLRIEGWAAIIKKYNISIKSIKPFRVPIPNQVNTYTTPVRITTNLKNFFNLFQEQTPNGIAAHLKGDRNTSVIRFVFIVDNDSPLYASPGLVNAINNDCNENDNPCEAHFWIIYSTCRKSPNGTRWRPKPFNCWRITKV